MRWLVAAICPLRRTVTGVGSRDESDGTPRNWASMLRLEIGTAAFAGIANLGRVKDGSASVTREERKRLLRVVIRTGRRIALGGPVVGLGHARAKHAVEDQLGRSAVAVGDALRVWRDTVVARSDLRSAHKAKSKVPQQPRQDAPGSFVNARIICARIIVNAQIIEKDLGQTLMQLELGVGLEG